MNRKKITLSDLKQLPALFIMGLIVVYRTCISAFIPARCRFLPTCSAYGIEALRIYGFLKGSALLLKRIGRCHPWGSSGHDPVPPKQHRKH